MSKDDPRLIDSMPNFKMPRTPHRATTRITYRMKAGKLIKTEKKP
ncbi:MAG: hypothetical protein WBD81_17985 [Collimonas pratensis]